MIFLDLSEGMENCKMSGKKSGKSQGILKWMISGNPAKYFVVKSAFSGKGGIIYGIFIYFSIGYPVVTLGFGFKTYVSYKMRLVGIIYNYTLTNP